MKITLTLVGLFIVIGCVSSEKKEKARILEDDKGRKAISSEHDDDEFYVSGNLRTLTVSLDNEKGTSKGVNKSEAAKIANQLQGTERRNLVGKLSATRLAGKGLGAVIEVTKKLMQVELQKNANRGIPEFAKMELVLAAVDARRYSYAEYFLYDLLRSKNARIRAMGFTVQGIIAADDNRLPEAIEYWANALDAVSNYEAAMLNLGFSALKYGDFALAKKYLGPLQSDWYAAYGLITAERLTDNAKKAQSLCERVLASKPNFKPALLGCALNEAQGLKNYGEATKLLDKIAKLPGFPNIDQRAQDLRRDIQRDKKDDQTNKKAK